MDAPENILLIRLKSIGDLAFTLPAVNAVRANFPSAKITFLTSSENAPLLGGFPAVDEVISLDRRRLRAGHPFRAASALFALLRRLRAGGFSLVVDFQGYGETAWLSWWTGAPVRWGAVYAPGREWLYTRGIPRDSRLHPARWNLLLLRQCGLKIENVKNYFCPPPAAMQAAARFFAAQHLDAARPTVFFQPLTSSPHKNWPLENYLALARHWRSRGAQIIFCGGPADGARLEPARAEGFCVATDLPLDVSAALAALCRLIVAGDTGIAHFAVAAGRPVVMVMAGGGPGLCVPFQHPEWAVAPQPGSGISTVPVSAVLAAAETALNEPGDNAVC
ncbi:MAG: glycosyltransferase family 9 protein [Verrucomicrobia bacterium]|nr:glycosyltransferase family 9 protein [Verrucomicrobiota bacterium]MDE3098607.1 glycosyltransferase family 9 protein [Verrucomicrobiota bacterium]